MFLLKKIISSLFLPLPVCTLLLIAGLIFLWFTGRQRLGRILVSLGAVTLLLFSNASLPNLLLQPLERPYTPMLATAESELQRASVSCALVTIFRGKFCETLLQNREVFSAAKGSPVASARAAAVIRESTEIPSHLSLSSGFRRA